MLKIILAVVFRTAKLGSNLFRVDLKAWQQLPKASPSLNLFFQAKCNIFKQKSLIFLMFQQFSPANFSVPGLTCLVERFYCISTSRILFYKILTLKISKIEIRAIHGDIFKVFALKFFNNPSKHPQGIFSVSLRGDRPGNTLFGLVNRENWRCNPIDVGVLQSQVCRRCGRVGHHVFVSA